MRQQKLLLVLVLAFVLGGCNWLRARDNLNKGVRAYRETNYPVAVEHFSDALAQDPELLEAELYLGMAYLMQYIPQLNTPENDENAARAIETFEGVLSRNPENTTAIAGLASLYQNTGDFDRARDAYKRQAEISQDDPVPYYGVGSLAWVTVRDPEADMTVEERQAVIDEGHEYLDRAIALDEYYEAALIYKNLLLREEAGLIPEDSEDEEALARREELIAMADEWFDKATEARQVIAEREAQGF
jgi:tetratricopeptide (TPR) repeat protein